MFNNTPMIVAGEFVTSPDAIKRARMTAPGTETLGVRLTDESYGISNNAFATRMTDPYTTWHINALPVLGHNWTEELVEDGLLFTRVQSMDVKKTPNDYRSAYVVGLTQLQYVLALEHKVGNRLDFYMQQWQISGVLQNQGPQLPGKRGLSRELVSHTHGDDRVQNIWGNAVHGAQHVWLVLKWVPYRPGNDLYVLSKDGGEQIAVGASINEWEVELKVDASGEPIKVEGETVPEMEADGVTPKYKLDEHGNKKPKQYELGQPIPQLVPVITDDIFVPKHELGYPKAKNADMLAYLKKHPSHPRLDQGIAIYVGSVIKNRQYKRFEQGVQKYDVTTNMVRMVALDRIDVFMGCTF